MAKKGKNWGSNNSNKDVNNNKELISVKSPQQLDLDQHSGYGHERKRDAMHSGHVIMRAIVNEKGVEFDNQPDGGWTPLHVASRYNPNTDISSVLIKHGANVMARTQSELTPLHLAAGWNSNAKVVTQLLQAESVEVDARDECGYTPLHFAAGLGKNAEVITMLVDSGAQLEAQEENGVTALHLAAGLSQDVHNVSLLLKAKVSPQVKNNFGDTPLHWAAYNKSQAAIQTVHALVQAEPSCLHVKNQRGRTPLDVARYDKNGNRALIEVFKEAIKRTSLDQVIA